MLEEKALKILIEEVSETLLWENASHLVETIQEIQKMVAEIGYINDLNQLLVSINRVEILESEDFIVSHIQKIDASVYLDFDMPFILTASIDDKQILRITANAHGSCMLLNIENNIWGNTAWTTMGKAELLSHKQLIKFTELSYSDCECDDVRDI